MKHLHTLIVLGVIMFFFVMPTMLYADRTVTDQLGRPIKIPDQPHRVVSLAPNITEIIFDIGREDRLKGVTRYSDFPPEAKKLPRVGSYIHLDLEKIVALKPDLCIAIRDGNPVAVARRLESLNIPVYAVDPRDLETTLQTVLDIGKLLNADNSAKQLVQTLQSRIQNIKSRVAETSYRPRVFVQIGVSPIVSVGTHTFMHELITLAGGINLAKGPVTYPRFNREQVVALSPEVIIITSMERAAIFKQVKAQWSQWPNLPAAENRRIFIEDSNLFDRPTPRLVDGLELLVRLIHPELFKETE